jgi:hypothetical protein
LRYFGVNTTPDRREGRGIRRIRGRDGDPWPAHAKSFWGRCAIRDAVPEWSLAEVVRALQAMRGIDLVAEVTVLAEIGDLSRR